MRCLSSLSWFWRLGPRFKPGRVVKWIMKNHSVGNSNILQTNIYRVYIRNVPVPVYIN
jgi:hypothetical protein